MKKRMSLLKDRSIFAGPTGPGPRLVLCAVVFLGSAGCASGAPQSEPAWPEQPSPSYPDANQKVESQSAPTMDEPASKPSPDISPTSDLAKRYDGKKALSTLKGKATYYADSLAGNHTANGDVYDPQDFTAAHKKLPFGTIVRVVRVDTGAETYARVNDRGPFGPADRIIDVSKAAAQELEMLRSGVVEVRVEVVEMPEKGDKK